MMKFRAEDGRVVMRSTKTIERTAAMRMAIESEAAGTKARAGELTQAVILKTLGEMMEKSIGEKLVVSSIGDFFAEWLASKTRTGKSAATVKRYRPILDGFVKSIGLKRSQASIGSVTATEVARFRDQQIDDGKSASTADFAVRVLQAALTSAHRQGLILQNPATAIESLDSVSEERDPFTDEQVAAILLHASQDWTGMILLGVHTGIRLNDAANLTWGDVDIEKRILSFMEQKTSRRKKTTNKKTQVYLHEDVINWLSRQQQGLAKAPLFRECSGRKSGSAGGLSNMFNRLMDQAGIVVPLGDAKIGKGRQFRKLGFHSLRHTFVSRLANLEVSSDIRKAMVGHSSDEVHRRYVHQDVTAQAVAVARLSGFLIPKGRSRGKA